MNPLRFFLLLPLLALLSACDNYGPEFEIVRRPLELAADRGDLAEVERLIAAGADIEGNDGTLSPLLQAASYEKNVAIVRVLLAAGANPNGKGKRAGMCWASPLGRATSSGNAAATRLLLEAGASINTECNWPIPGYLTPPVIDLLVEYGLDLYAVDEQGRNALHVVLQPPMMPRAEGVEYLIHAGVPLNALDKDGKTPLAHWREPRYHEIFEFRRWLFYTVFGEPGNLAKERKQRTEITEMLANAGATL